MDGRGPILLMLLARGGAKHGAGALGPLTWASPAVPNLAADDEAARGVGFRCAAVRFHGCRRQRGWLTVERSKAGDRWAAYGASSAV